MLAVAMACVTSGCGGGDDFANDPRPPPAITISAAIAPGGVAVSPARFGAGAVELVASNQTATSQQLTLRSTALAGGRAAIEQRTGPINPGDTALLTADLTEGTYVVTARSGRIAPARLEVGPPRPGGKDALLQP